MIITWGQDRPSSTPNAPHSGMIWPFQTWAKRSRLCNFIQLLAHCLEMFAPMVRYDSDKYDDVWWYVFHYVPLTYEDATATGWTWSNAARQDRTLPVLNCKVTFNCLQFLPSSSSSLAEEQTPHSSHCQPFLRTRATTHCTPQMFPKHP